MGSLRIDHESGAALIAVIGLTFVMTLVSLVALNFVRNAQSQARQHQDWHAALAAADAGIDDYLARLNRDLDYHEVDPASMVPGTPNYNAGLDPNAWAPLVDSQGEYTYTVDASEQAVAKTIRVISTGRVNGTTRTVEASLRMRTFLDFIYFTDIEPGASFTTLDDVRGPLHSNDTLVMSGRPTFRGPVTVALEADPVWDDGFALGDPDFQAGEPQQVPRIQPPPSNAALSSRAVDTAGGCLYRGPTYIRIDGDRMRVHSPRTVRGENGTDFSCLGEGSTDWLDLPDSGVIYVQDAPHFDGAHPLGLSGPVDRDGTTLSSTQPPRGGNWHQPSHRRAGDVFVWGELNGRLTIGAQRDVVLIWDLTYADPDTSLLGLIANYHINVWHPTDSNRNLLPVTASGSAIAPFPHAEDMPPLRTGADCEPEFLNAQFLCNPRFDAAMLALNGSFRIYDLFRGDLLGDIFVNGAISQQRRHAVGGADPDSIDYSAGTFELQSGYGKQYTYDERLQYLSPPYFINPVDSQYRLIVYAEVERPADLPD